jgi:TolB protein
MAYSLLCIGRRILTLISGTALLVACADEAPLSPQSGESPVHPAFAAGGGAQGKIVFASNLYGPNDIWVINADGNSLQNLSNWPEPSTEADPALSPDGKYVAYMTDIEHLNGDLDLYVMTADGSTGWRVGSTLPASQYSPVWSPDGKRIAFASEHTGNVEIFVIHVDGTGLTQVTNDPGVDLPGSWGRAGLYFESTRNGDREIYRMSADGSGVLQLTTNPGPDARPRISPNGKHILFESTRDGDLEIYTMAADGTNQVRMTNSPSKDYMAAWSPNGKQIVFISDRRDLDDLFLMNADGSAQRMITGPHYGQTGIYDTTPSWSR